MKLRMFTALAMSSLILIGSSGVAVADAAKPGQSMTHMKTAAGVVSATVPQAGNAKIDVLTITNASTAKPKITNDRKAKLRTTAYMGTTLVLAPGVAATIASVLGLPAGSLPDGLAFGTADVSLYSRLK